MGVSFVVVFERNLAGEGMPCRLTAAGLGGVVQGAKG
jgi:hypothetical protein